MKITGQRSKPTNRKRREVHISTKVREAIRCGLFDQTEDHKAGHLAMTPTDNCPRRTERAVLLELVDYAGKDGRMCPAVDTLAADLEMGERTVRRAIHCLRARGILLCIMQGGRSRGDGEYSGASVFLLNSQLIQRLYEERMAQTLPPVILTDEPEGFFSTNNSPNTTTVEGGGVDDLEGDSEADPPRQPKQEQVRETRKIQVLVRHSQPTGKPSRWKHTRQEIVRALTDAGCDTDRAALWFKYSRPNPKTGLFAPRYGFDDLRADAAEWYSRDTGRSESKPMSWAEMRAHAERNRLTIVADYIQLDGNLWRPKPRAKA